MPLREQNWSADNKDAAFETQSWESFERRLTGSRRKRLVAVVLRNRIGSRMN
jgi:hypothetical protein